MRWEDLTESVQVVSEAAVSVMLLRTFSLQPAYHSVNRCLDHEQVALQQIWDVRCELVCFSELRRSRSLNHKKNTGQLEEVQRWATKIQRYRMALYEG